MHLSNTLKSVAAGTGLALVMAVAAIAPAQASSFSLGLGVPGFWPAPFYNNGAHITLHFGSPDYFKYCLDDDEIESGLGHKGWDNVHVIRHDHDDDWDNKVWVVAENYKGDWYQMRVDRCTHEVDEIHLVHKHKKGIDFNFQNYDFTFSY